MPGRVVITGGGTGGHVYPSLAFAEALVAHGYSKDEILFIGSERGLEATVIPAEGFGIELLPGRGIRRALTFQNVTAGLGLSRAYARALQELRRFRPDVVVGFGGYASAATVMAARTLRIPVVVHEQNASPGWANRMAVRLGARAAVSYASTPLRNRKLVGNPTRRDIQLIVRKPIQPPLVAIVGGSLGARTLNKAALELYTRWRDRTDVQILHVCGPRNFDACSADLEANRNDKDKLHYDLVAYKNDMSSVYKNSTIMVCRAGALTVAELAVTGTPAIFVPLPNAPGDHQGANARAFVDIGAARMLRDDQCDGEHLDKMLSELLNDPHELDVMSKAMRQAAVPEAADDLVSLMEDHAGIA